MDNKTMREQLEQGQQELATQLALSRETLREVKLAIRDLQDRLKAQAGALALLDQIEADEAEGIDDG